MLNPEQAAQMLEGFRAEGWQARRRSRVARLPSKLSEVGWAMLACDSRGKPIKDWKSRERALVRAARQLDELSQGNRLKIFEALFPEIFICVERAWLLQTRLPYQSGWTRKAFRAPNTPRTTQQARGGWLRNLIPAVEGYQQDVVWFAAWAPYLRGGIAQDALGILFAAAIDAGDEQGDAVFDTLLASARGEHEIGAMGRHVPRALLIASRPDGWEFVEKLLLAAQRQEGLRQVILETIDEAHPEAFRRMLHLIREHDLARFSAVVRAVDTWFGFQWESRHKRDVDEILAHAARFLEDSDARADAHDGEDSQATYLVLWTMAFEDATAAVEPAARLLDDPDVKRRFVSTHLLTQLGLVSSQKALLPALEDQDLRIVASALNGVQRGARETFQETDLFERLERIVHRFPRKKKTLEPIVWPWTALPVEQQMVASTLTAHLGDRSPKRILPYLKMWIPGAGRASWTCWPRRESGTPRSATPSFPSSVTVANG